MQEALKRDGSSFSAWTLDQARQWWKEHKPGNPQLGLERFVQEQPSRTLKPGRHVWVTFDSRGRLVDTEVEYVD